MLGHELAEAWHYYADDSSRFGETVREYVGPVTQGILGIGGKLGGGLLVEALDGRDLVGVDVGDVLDGGEAFGDDQLGDDLVDIDDESIGDLLDLEDSAVIGATWHFGNQLGRTSQGRGPLTMVLTRTGTGLRISHVHFGNYAPGG